jgi:hypothetical protein
VQHVNQAMTQVDRVTQTNAAAAEELTSTAGQLASRAQELQKLMSSFQIYTEIGGTVKLAQPAAARPQHDRSQQSLKHPLRHFRSVKTGRDNERRQPDHETDRDYQRF